MKYSMLVLMGAVLSLSACEKKGSSSSAGTAATYSCVVSNLSVCFDYGTGYTAATSRSSCTQLSGTYSATAACATTDVVGSCAITANGITITTRYYSTLFNAAQAQAGCTENNGTFTAASMN